MTHPIVSSKVFCYPSRAVRGAAPRAERRVTRPRGQRSGRAARMSCAGNVPVMSGGVNCDHQTGAGLDVHRIYTCAVTRLVDNNSRALVVR